jgi:tRNA nucleotidyltransferase (CCA-adding enzyme)
LDRPTAEAVCRRLAFGQADTAVIGNAGRHGCPLDGQPSAVTRCLEQVPAEALTVEWLALEEGHPSRTILDRFLGSWRWVRSRADGNRLRELGLPPGPAYGEILHELRAAWLDGRIASEAEEAELLGRLLGGRVLRG